MVMCSELATTATTVDNKFLIWGSRPIIRTPLSDILAQGMASSEQEQSEPSTAETPLPNVISGTGTFTNDGNQGPERVQTSKDTPLAPVLPSQGVPSILLASYEQTPQEKTPPTSTESISIKRQSSDSVNYSNPKISSADNLSRVGRGSNPRLNSDPRTRRCSNSLSLADIPHVLLPCTDASTYLHRLSEHLSESTLDDGRAHAKTQDPSPHASSFQLPPAPSTRALKRGPSMNTCGDITTEGVLLKPIAIDLVGKSTLGSLPWLPYGLRDVKLEGVSCFGSNVLVLIEAHEQENTKVEVGGVRGMEAAVAEPGKMEELKPPKFRLGRKLVERRISRYMHNLIMVPKSGNFP